MPEVRDGLLAEPILADGAGTIAVPEAPGLGIVLDEDKLARYGEKFFDITTRGIAVKTIREKGLFTALRLARYFGTSEAFWMGLQADYDLEEARERLGDRLDREVRSRAA